MSSGSRTRPRLNGIQTRKEILAAALIRYCEYGYGGVSISDIARAARMSKPKILYHFADTDEILAELARLWGESGRQVTVEYLAGQNALTVEDKIVAVAEAMFAWMEARPEMAKLTPTLFQAVRGNSKVERVIRETFDVGAARIQSLLAFAAPFKSLTAKEQKNLARSIHSVMVGGALYVISTNDWPNISLYRSTTYEGIRSILSSRR